MRESLFSPLWHRYSQQRPRLRSHVAVQPQQYRDKTWYLLTNTTSGNHYRINQVAYQFIGRCDGHHPVQAVWDSLLEALGDDAPTQDEIIALLNELDQRDLIRYEVLPNIQNLFRRRREKKQQKQRAAINPFAMRLPLWDPSRFVARLDWLGQLLFNPLTLLLWLGAVGAGLLSATANWDEISAHFAGYMGTPRYLLLAWLCFPVLKAMHEMGHALAVHHWGGQVKETGITLFLLTPAPYVDASAASTFRRPSQRVLVGAMGMMVELLLAALGLLVWHSTQPGVVHDLAFVTMFICSVATLMFNGNPLLRFDAYYILCDLLDLPNLATRSRTFWVNICKRLVAGARGLTPLETAEGEAKWLLLYAPLSYVFTLGVMSYAVLWLGSKSLVVGILGGVFVVLMLVVWPLVMLVRSVMESASTGGARWRARLFVTFLLGGILGVFFLAPAPLTTTAQGVVWIPDEAHIRPEVEGFVREFRVAHGEMVEPGQILLILEDSDLRVEHLRVKKQVDRLRGEQYNLAFEDAVRAVEMNEKIDQAVAEQRRLEEKIDSLLVRSKVKGVLVMPSQADLQGAMVKKGQPLGYVLNREAIRVRVAVPEPDAALLRERMQAVRVRTADRPEEEIPAYVESDTNTVTRTLPAAALADTNGGRYPVDPEDAEGLTTTEPVVLLDIKMPSAMLERAGGRAMVRFDLGTEPLAVQAYWRLRQLFLRYFATSG